MHFDAGNKPRTKRKPQDSSIYISTMAQSNKMYTHTTFCGHIGQKIYQGHLEDTKKGFYQVLKTCILRMKNKKSLIFWYLMEV